MASRKRDRSSSPDAPSDKIARLASPPLPLSPSQSLVPARPLAAQPVDILCAICDFLDLPTAGLLARHCRATAQAVRLLDAIKGRRLLQSDPALWNHAAFDVWRSESGLRLLGRTSSSVTLDQLRLIYPSLDQLEQAALPRIRLLRFLTTELPTAAAAGVLQLFARGQLHLHRFDSHVHRLLESSLLDPQALAVVRTGWLSEDALFLLDEGHDQTWDMCQPPKQKTLLQTLVRGAGHPSDEPTIIARLAREFLPLTTDDVACLRARCVRAWSGVVEDRAYSIRAQAARVPTFFTIAAMERHLDAWRDCQWLHSDLARACTSCPCQCGSQFRSLCTCDCLPPGCSFRRVQKFKEQLARLGSHFLGVPPTAEEIAAAQWP